MFKVFQKCVYIFLILAFQKHFLAFHNHYDTQFIGHPVQEHRSYLTDEEIKEMSVAGFLALQPG